MRKEQSEGEKLARRRKSYLKCKSKWLDMHGVDEDFNHHIPGGVGSVESIEFFKNLFKLPENLYYATHMKALSNKFMMLSPFARSCVIAFSDDGIYWRGEGMDHFTKVAEEKERFNELGRDKYKIEAKEKSRRMLKRFTI